MNITVFLIYRNMQMKKYDLALQIDVNQNKRTDKIDDAIPADCGLSWANNLQTKKIRKVYS